MARIKSRRDLDPRPPKSLRACWADQPTERRSERNAWRKPLVVPHPQAVRLLCRRRAPHRSAPGLPSAPHRIGRCRPRQVALVNFRGSRFTACELSRTARTTGQPPPLPFAPTPGAQVAVGAFRSSSGPLPATSSFLLYDELEISSLRVLINLLLVVPVIGSAECAHSSSQQQQTDPNFQDIPTQSWYPPSVVGSSSHPSTPTSSSASPHQRASDNPQPSSRGQPSPAEAAGIIARLKDKSIEELQRILKDKEAYNAFFNSLDQVKTQNNVRDELRKETLQLARENLEKEQRILELRNQCTIIRTTELAAAQDQLTDLERQKDEIMRLFSPAALLDKLQTSMAKLDEESEDLHQKFLEKDIDLATFVQKYKKLRTAYHKQALLHLAGQTSLR